MNTKNNPGCYHSALRYLSELTGLPATQEMYFDRLDQLRSKPNKNRVNQNSFKSVLLYRSHNIKVETECGKTVSYMQAHNKRYDQLGYVAKRFIVNVNRPLTSFGVDLESVGTYKDSLGGGWHSDIELFRHKDFYFAPSMECGHC